MLLRHTKMALLRLPSWMVGALWVAAVLWFVCWSLVLLLALKVLSTPIA